jgi:hypothetical protein
LAKTLTAAERAEVLAAGVAARSGMFRAQWSDEDGQDQSDSRPVIRYFGLAGIVRGKPHWSVLVEIERPASPDYEAHEVVVPYTPDPNMPVTVTVAVQTIVVRALQEGLIAIGGPVAGIRLAQPGNN